MFLLRLVWDSQLFYVVGSLIGLSHDVVLLSSFLALSHEKAACIQENQDAILVDDECIVLYMQDSVPVLLQDVVVLEKCHYPPNCSGGGRKWSKKVHKGP